ncbi:MAG: hypothetical protein K8T25_06855 [Planctomycetia bacterium]|nr:hypothetical protein [Planctomycetia bacterium]
MLQPLVASIIAIRVGIKDAREGRPVFFWTVALNAAHRHHLLREAWDHLGKIFVVAIVLDFVYQAIVLHWIYPVQSLIVATVLAILPYLVLRGVANRVTRLLDSKSPPK